ncbi:MAG: hypothetical protein AB1894_18575 [Chloroflexota bacterium]
MRKMRLLFAIALLSLLAVSAGHARLVRFDVINKSGMDIAISMRGKELEQFYYLKAVKGDRLAPTEKNFTVVGDFYRAQVYYLQSEEPEEGYRCKQPKPTTLNMIHNVRLVVLECIREPIYTGEPYMLKFPILNLRIR